VNAQPRKRAAVGDGISAGSGSPFRDSTCPPPRRSKARPTSPPVESLAGSQSRDTPDTHGRPHVGRRQLWSPDQEASLTKLPFNDPSKIGTAQPPHKTRKPFTASPQIPSLRSTIKDTPGQHEPILENYDIILQPETRPISQEQLVAEVKGIYAGLVMVEGKCIEIDNKQATLAQAEEGAQPKLNNEQWQALIALHRTLLHEHHDFFLASQHPSASPVLRRLASKYTMPARMWRHGIHSFLELLRHRLPASLDHMLAFIYLAYSMMALLYETVPAFEETWIECLGDLGRYRMAIEDDDIRDREVWTGVARHWYSKASDKAPTTGRLYHHLAILARPNALQQLFYYSKSLCVVIPFTSARESTLTLFDPVLNAENHQGQYRLPPLDASFVKAHGLLFTKKNMEKFNPTVNKFLSLLDNQIGRVTRKFMEQGYHIAVANCIAMLGFASKDNVLMKAIFPPDVDMEGSPSDHTSQSLSSFRNSQRLSNSTLKIVPQRVSSSYVDIEGARGNCSTNSTSSRVSSRGNQTSFDAHSESSPHLSIPHSKRGIPVRRSLRGWSRIIGTFALCSQLGIVAASPTAIADDKSSSLLELISPAAPLFVTLGVGMASMRLLKRYCGMDLTLLMDLVTPGALLFLAADPRISQSELVVVYSYGMVNNYLWIKHKLTKLAKTGGLHAFLIVSSSGYLAWKLIDHFPVLQERFENPLVAKAILALPTAVVSTAAWVAIIHQTGFAEAIEAGVYNPHIWDFFKGFLQGFIVRFLERAVGALTNWLFGPRAAPIFENVFQEPTQDVEAHSRNFIPIHRNEPFRGPGNGDIYRAEGEHVFPDLPPSPPRPY